jgi:hypothetical protein
LKGTLGYEKVMLGLRTLGFGDFGGDSDLAFPENEKSGDTADISIQA